jgi:hypothetical protein
MGYTQEGRGMMGRKGGRGGMGMGGMMVAAGRGIAPTVYPGPYGYPAVPAAATAFMPPYYGYYYPQGGDFTGSVYTA